MNNEIHVSFSVLVSSGYMPRSGIAGSYGGFIPSETRFLKPDLSATRNLSEWPKARILEWVAFPFSGGSSPPRDRTRSPALQADSLAAKPQRKTVWRLLKKLRIKPPYDPAIPLLGIYPEETKI